MLYVATNGQLYDDGYGMQTAPAYAMNERNERVELAPEVSQRLTEVFRQSYESRLPLGDAVARVTGAFGMKPCAPCQKRQAALNRFGDRVARWWR
jgi:hypothetical protein